MTTLAQLRARATSLTASRSFRTAALCEATRLQRKDQAAIESLRAAIAKNDNELEELRIAMLEQQYEAQACAEQAWNFGQPILFQGRRA